jgi:hypothetical protein
MIFYNQLIFNVLEKLTANYDILTHYCGKFVFNYNERKGY